MNRILIVGSAGSGKSTLAQQLGEALSLPVVHLDRYYWKPGWIATPNEEWDNFVIGEANREQWIMDGNYSRTLDLRLQRADAVIFLDMPRLLCLYRVIKRRVQYHGKTRADMNEGCPEKLDWPFLGWVWNYKKRSRTKVLDRLKRAEGSKRIYILKTKKEVNRLLEQLRQEAAE
ncbi:DNA topology modulation protein [Cohnella lubricantis]|uniref:DNA topology modulation protein n=1 Tax=Cohnella lubricantis TaxID=2163172 RepID=A0A841TEV0_9BACL|nr:DNA topology modulation protein [Cohnella lubricantis]MBB6678509.1 DNA topology modulation protein [Cohnella lubricantis]MBP2118432.1 adenylate kinase family enzyme [Cohnella lubricantis]